MSGLLSDADENYSYGTGGVQGLKNFNADISKWDTSGVTDMKWMFYVSSSPANPYTSPRTICPLSDSAGGILLVRRQQAVDPLRMGGHLGLCLCWLWLELGFRQLPLAAQPAAALALAVTVLALAAAALAAATLTTAALAAAISVAATALAARAPVHLHAV